MHCLVPAVLLAASLTFTPLLGAQSAAPSEATVELMQQGGAAMRSNQPEQAAADFQQAIQKSPRFAEAYLNLGLALTAQSKNEEADAALRKGLALKPTLRGAHLFLAIADYKLNRLDQAAEAVRKETAAGPKDAQAWMWQGIIDLAQSHVGDAVKALQIAAQLDPGSVDILYHRGRAALALSRESYQAMFKLDPASWRVHQVLAQADVESDRDAEAVDEYKLAIAAAPAQLSLYEALGSSLWRIGKFQEAQQAFETALKLDPNDTITLYKLGCLKIDHGDAAGGKPLLERVVVADPSLKLTAYYLGRADAELGDDQHAIALFKQVIAENIDTDTSKQAYFQLSRLYRRLHDNAAAASAQAEYRRLDQVTKDAFQEKLSQRRLTAERDRSIPSPNEGQASPQ